MSITENQHERFPEDLHTLELRIVELEVSFAERFSFFTLRLARVEAAIYALVGLVLTGVGGLFFSLFTAHPK